MKYFLLVFLFPGWLLAAMLDTDGSPADVQAKLVAAQAGDTVVIPAGNFEWAEGVSVSVAPHMILQGAGMDQTVIIDNFNSASPLLSIGVPSIGEFRMIGIAFQSGSANVFKSSGTINFDGPGAIRIDHCYIKSTSPANSKTVRFGIGISSTLNDCILESPRPTPTPAPTIIMGEPNVFDTNDSNNGNLVVAQRASLSEVGITQSLSFYVVTASGSLRLGIYDSMGPSGGPGNRLAETPEFTPVVGWNTRPVTFQVVLAPGTYWLVYFPSSSALAFKNAKSGQAAYYSLPYGPLPDTFSTAPNGAPFHWSFFATLTAEP